MKKFHRIALATFLLSATLTHPIYSQTQPSETLETKQVAKITIKVETLAPNEPQNTDRILARMSTKVGDPFSQITFDHDLKMLSDEYDRAEPTILVKQGEIHISIKLWQKPIIRQIKWSGNNEIKTRKLQKELGIKPNTIFNREDFNKAFNKVKEYYIKKGYFDSQLQYRITPDRGNNEIEIEIHVDEGHTGRIDKIEFHGFDKAEESDLLHMINSKKYNFFTSWLTGTGTYHEEALEQDKLVILNYLQNKGYADALVNIELKDSEKSGKLFIEISSVHGEIFHFSKITFEGNELFDNEKIESRLLIHDGDTYSPEKLRDTLQSIKDLYGEKGYIDTSVRYNLQLNHDQPSYNVSFYIEEGEQYNIGLVRVLGNMQTSTSVILHESQLIPGEIFDSRMLRVTQHRLESMGYFKSVNVYAVRTTEDKTLGENYRDVIIEVEETTTGNLSLFFGFSTVDDLFGGLDLAENNFNYKGLGRIWKDGLPAIRGGGEYTHLKASIGKRQNNYTISWLTPYFRDSLWRVGFDVNYSQSRVQSKDYDVNTLGFALYGSYPLTPYWTSGWKYRIRNAIIKIDKSAGEEAVEQEKNSGIATGFGLNLTYDSTDNVFKPHRGIRSILEAEIAGVRRHASSQKGFPFLRVSYVNTFYYPIWRKGTLKTRGDFKFIDTFGQGTAELLPLSERFFLGGETSVRGYRAYQIGPKYGTGDPTGGISSILLSVEYLQNIFKMLDLFVFADGGSISMSRVNVHKMNMSWGYGARFELANRVPLIVGYGYPINASSKSEVRRFFFSMGGQF
ncbi:MAG: outer membrane protein assembly factor BamA [Simkaniaceae bacterium]|nr:outer membrane protein assembly factor BamA [Simkaniaceae bacterium]